MIPPMPDDIRTGSCLCGAIEFEAQLPSKWCAHCHCVLCRRAHAAPFVTWVGMEAERFRITKGEDRLVRYWSSERARRSFCSVCGTTMLFEGDRWPDEVHVARACIDGEIDREPAANAYWDRHVAWGASPEALPRYGGEDGTTKLGD